MSHPPVTTVPHEPVSAAPLPSLRVAYVFMQFPVPSQTFAAVDLRQLRARAITVRCDALRSAHADAQTMLNDRGLAGVPVTHAGFTDLWHALVEAACHPLRCVALITLALWWGRIRPRHLLAGVAIVPRVLSLSRTWRRWQPDVVHVFWGHYPMLAAWYARRTLPRCVISGFLGAYDLEHRYPGSATMANAADVVITHAQANLPDLVRQGISQDKITVIHRGIDPASFRRPVVEKIPGRVVIASRLVHDKGIDVALRALAIARTTHPELHLLIVGDGPYRRTCEDLSRTLGLTGQVTFAGHVPHTRVLDEMDRAELVLLPSASYGERLPNALKEAMAARCVVITSPTPGIDELVTDGTTGFILPHGDASGIAATMTRLHTERSLRQTIAEAAYRTVVERFNAGSSMAAYHALWLAAYQRRSSTPST